MRYIQPLEAIRLLQALLQINQLYYDESDYPTNRAAYIEKLETTLKEMALISQEALEEIYEAIEAESTTNKKGN